MEALQSVKLRFGIIGNDVKLNRAIERAMQVAPTDISVLVVGESGVGKEFFPKIIHQLSPRKHKQYIAVNCGALPEGTIDSELFGHEKGAFTGADKQRKGYFEVADGGTIFLDEIGELPLQTQVRLLRVLESGEFMKVGSSEVQKTNVRIVAATNVNMIQSIREGKFREDLYYRLNTVQLDIPALRERKEDIALLFRKFCVDFSEKYSMPPIHATDDALRYIQGYRWPGNIRQLRNFAEQVTVVEQKRELPFEKVKEYLQDSEQLSLVSHTQGAQSSNDFANEREILYKVLFDMKKDLNDLKSLTLNVIQDNQSNNPMSADDKELFQKVYSSHESPSDIGQTRYLSENKSVETIPVIENPHNYEEFGDYEEVSEVKEESLSLQNKEKEFIKKALHKYNGRRKQAAEELGISERTLYRKIKQYDIEN